MLARRAKRTSVVLEFASFTNFSRCASSSSIALAFRIAASKVHVHLGVGQLQIVLLNTKHYTSSSECHLVRFVRMGNPKEASADAVNAMQGSYYSLSINFNPGALEQPWEMLSSPSHTAYTKGHGTPQDIAKRVCAIVKHEGATLSD